MSIDNNLIVILLLFVICALALIIVILIFFLLKVLSKESPKIDGPPQASESPRPSVNRSFCSFHSEEHAVSTCAICHQSICQSCYRETDGLHFCSEHLRTYTENQWALLSQVRSSVEQPEDGLEVYLFKTQLWDKDLTPSYLVTHYQIDVQGDYVETLTSLYVKESELESLQEQFHAYKKASQ